MTPRVDLLPIERGGHADVPAGTSSPELRDVLTSTAGLYESAGFVPPWICYLVTRDGGIVGTCGFKGPPRDGRVEIAYFTFPPNEGAGLATAMAQALVSLASRTDPRLVVFAQTLQDRNASHRVLEKLGFERAGLVEHAEDGTILEWVRPPAAGARPPR